MSFTGALMGTLMDSHEIQGEIEIEPPGEFEIEIEPPGPPLPHPSLIITAI